MKVLVTGGAGYVGTALLPLLLEAGHEVTVFDCLLFGGDQLFAFSRHKGFKFVRGDIRNRDELAAAVKGKDCIVHLAAIVGYPACRANPELAEQTNVTGTRNLIEVTNDDQLILFGSTGSNYGEVEEICTEDTPLRPLSLYGQTKTLAEHLLLEKRRTIAYRFATAFGLSTRLRLDLLVNDFTYKAMKEKYLVVYERHFMRTFIHVHDMARAFIFAIEHRDQMVRNVYNIGSNRLNFSKQDICEKIRAQTGAYIHYSDVGEDADKRNYVVSYDKVKSLGYEVTIDVDEGISEIIKAMPLIQVHNRYVNA